MGLIAMIAYGMLVFSVLGAVGVFLYGRVLSSQLASQDAALAKAHSSIDATTVADFVRLQNRLSSGKQLLDNHIALSGFFTALENILPSSVQLTSLTVAIDDTGTANVTATGVAKTFNALAAASNAFAADGRIKDAIFSNIQVAQAGGVSFALTASLDPSLIAYTPSAPVGASAAANIPVGTTTASTTP